MHESTNQSVLNLVKQYTKKSVFEVFNAPAIFKYPVQPEYKLEIQINPVTLPDDQHEVTLILLANIKSTHDNQNAFQAIIQQAGVFTIKNIPKNEQETILNTTCPTLLCPYAIERLNNVILHGGFPPLNIMPLNFAALYARKKQQQAQSSSPKQGANEVESTNTPSQRP